MAKPLVVITGASSGIGAVMAKTFNAAGYPLALLARNTHAMGELKLSNSLCLQVDVTHNEQFTEAMKAAEQEFGPVDCLINNAGFAKSGKFVEITENDHKTMVDVNVLGVIHGSKAVLPSMQLRKTGTIINVSSIADRNARPNLATYAATKAAVKSLTESLRMANAQYGIRICNVAPALVRTPMLTSASLDDKAIIEPEDLAKATLWLYEQPQNICIRELVIAPTYYAK